MRLWRASCWPQVGPNRINPTSITPRKWRNIIERKIPRILPSARICRGSGPDVISASPRKRRWPLPIASSVCASSALSATSTRLTNGHKPTSTRSRPSLSASPWAAKTYRRTRATTTATSPISCARWPTTIPRIRPKTETAPSGQWWRNAWRLASRCLGRRCISAPNKTANTPRPKSRRLRSVTRTLTLA